MIDIEQNNMRKRKHIFQQKIFSQIRIAVAKLATPIYYRLH